MSDASILKIQTEPEPEPEYDQSLVALENRNCQLLQNAQQAMILLRGEVDSIANADFKSWDVSIIGESPNFLLQIGLYPNQGIHLLDDTQLIFDNFSKQRINGFAVEVKYHLTEKTSASDLAQQHFSLSLENATFQRRMKHVPMVLFMTKESLQAVKNLRALSTDEQIEFIRNSIEIDFNEPYITDEAAEVGQQIMKNMPFLELLKGGNAVPSNNGDLTLEWGQDGYDVIITISNNGLNVDLWLCDEMRGIDFQTPVMSSSAFIEYLTQRSKEVSPFLSYRGLLENRSVQ